MLRSCARPFEDDKEEEEEYREIVNFNLADSRIYCLRACLDTLNIPTDRLALQEYSKTMKSLIIIIITHTTIGANIEKERKKNERLKYMNPE